MEETLSNKVKKVFNKNKKRTIILILGIALVVGLFYIPEVLSEKMPKEPESLLELVENGVADDKTYGGKYAEIDVAWISTCIATHGEEGSSLKEKYYIIFDENGYMYVAQIPDYILIGDLSYVDKYSAGEIEEAEAVNISGITKTIPSELKKIVTEELEKSYNTDITDEDFRGIFGGIYLDTSEGPFSFYEGACYVLAAIFIIIDIVIFSLIITSAIINKRSIKKIKKNNELDSFYDELDSTDVKTFDGVPVVLTQNYMVDYNGNVKLFRYDEIKWIYSFIHNINFSEAFRAINIITKDNKKYTVSVINSNSRTIKQHPRILEELANKCPDALVGFTDENKKAYEEYKKECKNKKI